MRVLVAMDSFKGSVSSEVANRAVASGVATVCPDADITCIPLADGGEGTVNTLVRALDGRLVEREVHGPLGEKVVATYGITKDGKTAIIEIAAACGLTLIPEEERNPLQATSYGVGELILDAMGQGCREFIIGLGGSATTDAGVGMLQALGFEFLDREGNEVGKGGVALHAIEQIETENAHPLLKECNFQIACDVQNYLYGDEGAAFVFAPQKGASPKEVEQLDAGLRHVANKTQESLGVDIHAIPGAGAAGGLGAAFSGFLNGKLRSGIEIILEITGVQDEIRHMDIVITGEGMLDAQTSMGKAPLGIAKLAQHHGVPVFALAGSISGDVSKLNTQGITACFSILQEPMPLEEAMEPDITIKNLEFTAEQVFRLIEK